LAALDSAPDADVMLVAHTGVDHLLTVADVWRELPMDKHITMQWWLEPASAVPAAPDERVEWLYHWWARIDAWIEENRAETLALAALATAGTAPPTRAARCSCASVRRPRPGTGRPRPSSSRPPAPPRRCSPRSPGCCPPPVPRCGSSRWSSRSAPRPRRR